MNEYRPCWRDRSQERRRHPRPDEKSQFLLRAEEEILQSISCRASLPELLNRICSALDCQIGNVVSLISLPQDDSSKRAAIAKSAALFGLHAFFSEDIVAENDELLGSLAMYSCVLCIPSLAEIQLIERARRLAAIAIERYNEAGHYENHRIRASRLVPGYVLESPPSMN